MASSSPRDNAGGRRPPEDPDSSSAAEEVALRILGAASQSAAGLRRRLQGRGFSEEAAAAATESMTARGYVDDAELAGSIAARRQRTGHGRFRVAAELRARGVEDAAITATLHAVDDEAERAAALELGRRLWASSDATRPDHERRHRIGGSMQRRGFDSDTVRWVLRHVALPEGTDPAD